MKILLGGQRQLEADSLACFAHPSGTSSRILGDLSLDWTAATFGGITSGSGLCLFFFSPPGGGLLNKTAPSDLVNISKKTKPLSTLCIVWLKMKSKFKELSYKLPLWAWWLSAEERLRLCVAVEEFLCWAKAILSFNCCCWSEKIKIKVTISHITWGSIEMVNLSDHVCHDLWTLTSSTSNSSKNSKTIYNKLQKH